MSVLAVPIITLPRFRLWMAWVFPVADAIALELALALGIFVRQALLPLRVVEITVDQYRGLAFGLLIVPLAYSLVGLYPGHAFNEVHRLRARVYTTFFVFAMLIFWDYAGQDRVWSRGILLATLLFALVLPPIAESLTRRWLSRMNCCGSPVIVLGAGSTGAMVVKMLRSRPALGLMPVALFDDNPDKWHTSIENTPVMGPLAAVKSFRDQVSTVIVAMPRLEPGRLTSLVHELSFPRVILIPDLFGMQSSWIEGRDLGGVLGLEVKKNLMVRRNRIIKRITDYAIALPMALLSLPIVLLAAAFIRAAGKGSPFYWQEREGAGGRTIRIWKLRTMYPDAERLLEDYLDQHPPEREEWHRHFKLKKDPRVLPGIGKLLRETSLDELPQLWNVLRGDMTLVGPRPFPRYHQDSFLPAFRTLRCSVPPGITGLWQVSSRSNGDLGVQESLDTYYIRNWSLWLDLYILGRTVSVVLNRSGAY